MKDPRDAGLEQLTPLNIPSSPLVTDNPDYFITSMMRLAGSYLQNHDVAYLGHAIKLVSPEAGSMCRRFGLKIFDEMIQTDPQVNQGVEMLYMAGVANTPVFYPSPTNGSPANESSARGGAAFVAEMFEQLENPFQGERAKCVYDMIRYGNSFGELEWGYGYGDLANNLVVTDIRAANISDVVMVTDSFNRIIGYAPYGFPGVVGPLNSWLPADSFVSYMFNAFETQVEREEYMQETHILPPWKVWHQQWLGRSDDPRGSALLDAAFQPWWAKQQMMSVLLLFCEKWGVPRQKGTLAEKASAICLFGPDGKPLIDPRTKMPIEQDPLIAFLTQMKKAGPGSDLAMPFGYDLDLLEANPDMALAIIKALDFFNIEISKAITKQHLASSEGQRGSEKGADSHGDILGLLIQHQKNIQSQSIRDQIAKPAIAANFGKQARRYAPICDLGDSDGFPVSLMDIGVLQQASYPFTTDQYAMIDRRIGIAPRTGGVVDVPRTATADAESLYRILAAKLYMTDAGQSLSLRMGK